MLDITSEGRSMHPFPIRSIEVLRHLSGSAAQSWWILRYLRCWALCLRVVHGSDGPAGRVGSGRVTILPDFGGSGRVSTSDFLVFY